MPGDSMLGAPVRARAPRPRTGNLRVVPAVVAGPDTGRASPPPVVTRKAMALFQLGLAAMCMVAVFVF